MGEHIISSLGGLVCYFLSWGRDLVVTRYSPQDSKFFEKTPLKFVGIKAVIEATDLGDILMTSGSYELAVVADRTFQVLELLKESKLRRSYHLCT